jgi:hypothetical protein
MLLVLTIDRRAGGGFSDVSLQDKTERTQHVDSKRGTENKNKTNGAVALNASACASAKRSNWPIDWSSSNRHDPLFTIRVVCRLIRVIELPIRVIVIN